MTEGHEKQFTIPAHKSCLLHAMALKNVPTTFTTLELGGNKSIFPAKVGLSTKFSTTATPQDNTGFLSNLQYMEVQR